jgi:hypothetical protein
MKYKMGDIVRCVKILVGITRLSNKVELCKMDPSGYGRKGIYVYAVEPYIPIPINKNVNKHQFI